VERSDQVLHYILGLVWPTLHTLSVISSDHDLVEWVVASRSARGAPLRELRLGSGREDGTKFSEVEVECLKSHVGVLSEYEE
jgi:hypothetical protein